MATQAQEDLASLAGFTVAFFNSDPELKALFNKALVENWTGDRLLQASRNTRWFKTHSSPEREAVLLRTSDPATYKANADEVNLRVTRMAVELGIPLGTTMRQTTSRLALSLGWNDDQIRNYLGRFKTVRNAVNQGQVLGGTIGQVHTRLQAAVRDYGVNVSRQWLAQGLNDIAAGLRTEQHIIGEIQKMAAAAFPGIAEQIKAGQSVREIAEPFIQTMAKLWEVNPQDIDLKNNTIRAALNVKGRTGDFSMMTLPEFETKLRKDPRWNKTDNAQDGLMQAGHEVLQQWGVTW